MPSAKSIALDEKEKYIAFWQVLIAAIISGGIALIGISMGFYIAVGRVPFQSTNFLESLYTLLYLAAGLILFAWGMTLNKKTFGHITPKEPNATKSTPLKILVDEMFDGLDIMLTERGYQAQSVKKLITLGETMSSDFSVLKYVEKQKMVLVTEDEQNIRGCNENKLSVIRFGQDYKLEELLTKLDHIGKS